MNEVAASPELAERLQRYSRMVALVAEQLDAVRDGDSERMQQLQAERALLESELDPQRDAAAESVDEDEEGGPDGIDSPQFATAFHEDLQSALELLATHWQTLKEAEENWNIIQDGAVRSARAVPAFRVAPRGYPEYERGKSRVDLRF